MLGALVRFVLAGGVVIAAGVAVVAVVPTPTPCTQDPAQPDRTFYMDKWNDFVDAPAPNQVGFDQAEANEALADALAERDLPVRNVKAHFCGDGSAQLAFEFPIGPVVAHVLAKGTITAPPVGATLDEVEIGGLPTAFAAPAIEMARDLVDQLSDLEVDGPVSRVEVRENAVILYNQ